MRLRWFYILFLASGFCSLVYEVVWLRLAMAKFGATTLTVSTVLSVFMAGLGFGSWVAARLVRRLAGRGAAAPLRLYAAAELLIAVSALAVPLLFTAGRSVLLGVERQSSWGSTPYYLASGAWIALSLIPFCTCMGATFPLAMSVIRQGVAGADTRSFSYLYLANVFGATLGVSASAFVLIELFGFSGALRFAAPINAVLAIAAFLIARRSGTAASGPPAVARAEAPAAAGAAPSRTILAALFTTGLASMAMEVVWIRQFTPFLGTLVYAFAGILALYLAATVAGSAIYRRASRGAGARGGALPAAGWSVASLVALLPLAAADPHAPFYALGSFDGPLRLIVGLAPFCGAMGFLTPMLVDIWSRGDGDRAGRAYAVNILGCIAGPLLAGFVLLPSLGERWSLVVLAAPLFALAVAGLAPRGKPSVDRLRPAVALTVALVASVVLIAATRDFESIYPRREIRRDYEATVIATGQGMQRQLLVNGYTMTVLSPVTKFMVHIPLALRPTPPRDVLVICFGMGTSFRSALTWGVPTTAVELVPSVPSLVSFFHADGAALMKSPLGRVVIDDGRRFLDRTAEQFDLITIDPPPPVEAAGSSMLYSKEFYAAARRRLRAGGLLAQWLPGGDAATRAAVTRALVESFPHVRVYAADPSGGVHYIASETPLETPTAAVMAARLPTAAAADMVEWLPQFTPEWLFGAIAGSVTPPEDLLKLAPDAPPITDDSPVNEYFLIRRQFGSIW